MKNTARGSHVTVGSIQLACSPERKENLARTVREIERLARDGAQIICTQGALYFSIFLPIGRSRFLSVSRADTGPHYRGALQSGPQT